MLTDEQRQAIVDEAMSWVNTPYRACACLKGAGVDCGQLLKGVYSAVFHFDVDAPQNYSVQEAQHRKTTTYIDIVSTYMREIPESEVKAGDVVVFKLGHAFAHAGIIKSYPDFIIHAMEPHGVTAGHATANNKFRKLPRKFFTLKDDFHGNKS